MARTLSVEELNHVRYQPLTDHIFNVEIDGIPNFLVRGFPRPSFDYHMVEIPFGNGPSRKVATGAVSQSGSAEFEMHESIETSTAQLVLAWGRTHSDEISGRGGYAAAYKRDCLVSVCDPMGNVVQSWFHVGCHISNLAFSPLSRDSRGEIGTVTVTLAYDKAILLF